MSQINDLIGALTLEEKVAMLSGSNFWHTTGVERLGIPRLKMTDGPNGARGDGQSGARAVCLPVGSALAATWNTDLLQEVGALLGREAKTKSAQVLLGPTINLHRTPLGGRNFECYSEDPYLTGALATAYTKGVQSEGVGVCLKHFVCNDSEFQRHTISSEVDERPLRELYLKPFEMAVKAAQPWAVMSAYNKINGTYASSHTDLTTTVLKDEWGFDGFVVSDWGACLETIENANGGLDIEMPGPARTWGNKLVEAVKSGDVEEATIDDKVKRILRIMERTGLFNDVSSEADERGEDTPENRATAFKAAVESMVLIKNDSNTLPFNAGTIKKIAVIGPNAKRGQIQGGGSSGVKAHYQSHPLDAIIQRLSNGVEVAYEVGCLTYKYAPAIKLDQLRTPTGEPGLLFERWDNTDFEGTPSETSVKTSTHLRFFDVIGSVFQGKPSSARLSGDFIAEESGPHTFGIHSAGFTRVYLNGQLLIDNWEGNWQRGDSFYTNGSIERRAEVEMQAGKAYAIEVEFMRTKAHMITGLELGVETPQNPNMMDDAVNAAKEADAVVLVVGTNADWETEGNDRQSLDLPGAQRTLIERVTAANPNCVVVMNTGGGIDMGWLPQANAAIQSWFGGQEYGNALAALIFGDEVPSAKMPTTFPHALEDTPAFTSYPGENGKVRYGEGLYMGYRWYDKRNIAPALPFGHGLSYVDFAYSDLEITRNGDDVIVSCTLTNKGARDAQEVVQLYVSDEEARLDRPLKELKGFTKMLVPAGGSARAEITLGQEAFAYWDDRAHDWVVEPGEFTLNLGASSRDIRLSGTVTLA